MDIKDFVESISPNFERSRMIEDIEMMRDSVASTITPTLKKLEKIMSGQPFKSKAATDLHGLIGANVSVLRNRTVVQQLTAITGTIADNLAYMEQQVPVMFAKDVTRETLTYRKSAFLQVLALSRFALDYTTRVLGYILESEIAVRTKGDATARYAKPELDALAQQLHPFAEAVATLYVPRQEFVHKLDNVPEITFDPARFSVVSQTVGLRNLSPFKGNLIATRLNPIYKARMMFAEWQVKRYKAKKEEQRALELRCLALAEALQGKQDAGLQQELDYTTGRLQSLNHELHQLEQKYG